MAPSRNGNRAYRSKRAWTWCANCKDSWIYNDRIGKTGPCVKCSTAWPISPKKKGKDKEPSSTSSAKPSAELRALYAALQQNNPDQAKALLDVLPGLGSTPPDDGRTAIQQALDQVRKTETATKNTAKLLAEAESKTERLRAKLAEQAAELLQAQQELRQRADRFGGALLAPGDDGELPPPDDDGSVFGADHMELDGEDKDNYDQLRTEYQQQHEKLKSIKRKAVEMVATTKGKSQKTTTPTPTATQTGAANAASSTAATAEVKNEGKKEETEDTKAQEARAKALQEHALASAKAAAAATAKAASHTIAPGQQQQG